MASLSTIARNDDMCQRTWQECPAKMVSWYLIASYAYYVLDNPILSDNVFDKLCRKLLEHMADIDHPHLELIEREALLSGTGFQLTNWPERVIKAAHTLSR